MIFRLVQKLNAKLEAGALATLPLDENPFADWSAHLFVAGRTQAILLSNTMSIYTMVLSGKGITNDSDLIERALSGIREFLEAQDQRVIYESFIAPARASRMPWPEVSASCGSKPQYDLRAPVSYGLWVGAEQNNPPLQNNAGCGDSSGSTVTMRWPIGTKQRQNYNDGMAYWGGWNKPLQSPHKGNGVNVLLCDGSVHFLSNNTAWNVLQLLSIRDDGQSVVLP